MAALVKNLKPNEILFREGDPSEAIYVVKKGKLSIFKQKGNQEVELAEVGPGQMIGEMAFFDRKPRSASIKAKTDTEVIPLPFKNLEAQYNTFPEWLKAMVKTMSSSLREANKKIKNLEKVDSESGSKGIPAHQANKLIHILIYVATKYGTPDPGGIDVPSGYLRKFTIQIFQEPTTRMATLIQTLQNLEMAKQEDLGEGRAKIVVSNVPFLEAFGEWLNDYLYVPEEKRVTVDVNELKALRALDHFVKKYQADDKGFVTIPLNAIVDNVNAELGYKISANDFNGLEAKKIIGEKISGKDGLYLKMSSQEIQKVFPFWTLYYAISG